MSMLQLDDHKDRHWPKVDQYKIVYFIILLVILSEVH